MTANVYRHRVRVITDQMIVRAIRLGIDRDQIEPLRNLYAYDGSDSFIHNYLQWDDARFMETFCPVAADSPGRLSGELLFRLRQRRLLKQIYSERIERLDARCREPIAALPQAKSDALRAAIETGIAQFLAAQLHADCAPEFVIAHNFDIKSVRQSSQNDEGEVLVLADDGQPRNFSEESRLLGSINQAFSDNFVEVYAPVDWPDRTTKNDLRQQWREPIREIVQDACHAHRRQT
jgi:HD superfamily phosphohydrolase